MAALIAGDFQGKAVKAEIGANPKSGKPEVRIDMQVTEGEHKGKIFNYNGKLDDKSIKYTKRDMVAVGWKGKDAVGTFASDVKAADKTVGFTVEIATWNKDDGTVKQWSTVRSIGYTPPPLTKLDADKARDVNGWFDDAGEIGDSGLPF